MKVKAYSSTGSATGEVNLDAGVFGLTPNHQLMAQAYQNYLSNNRTNNARTKTRGLVAGGGRKPYRQKGTGRARTGSIRNPIWRGGGITFGPTGKENFKSKLPRTMAQTAFIHSLSAQAEIVRVIDKFAIKQPKTKQAVELIDKIGVEGSILIIVDILDETTRRAVRNLPYTTIAMLSTVTVFDILNADAIVIEKAALTTLKAKIPTTKASKKATASK